MKKLFFAIGAVFLFYFLACSTGEKAAVSSPSVDQAKPVKEIASSRAQWEEKWATVLAAAKKEGTVSNYTLWRPEVRNALVRAFKEKYGISLEFTSFGRGAELLAKMQAEKRAGIYAVDVVGAGATTLLASMKPYGVLGPIRPLFMLPEILEPKNWIENTIPVVDKEDTTFAMLALVIRTVVYNTDLVREGEITGYMDLLKPQYKGKITLNDPTVTGSGNAVIYHILYNLWGEQKTADFLRRLILEQDVVIQRDNRIHMETVAKGKYAIGLAPLPDLVAEFQQVKAPVKIALVEEDNRLTSAAGALGVPTEFAHPNAAKVFVNWLLSKEGQTVFVKAWGNPSTRLDVPTTDINPLFVPVPGKKYYLQTEEEVELRGKALDWSKNIIESAKK